MFSKHNLPTVGISIAVALLLLFAGFRYARSFFDHTAPEITVTGIGEGEYACDMRTGKIIIDDRCSLKNLDISLDGKSIFSSDKSCSTPFEYPLTVDTKTLADGKHILTITARDDSRHENQSVKQIGFFIDNVPLEAALVADTHQFRVMPGRVLHVRATTSKEIKQALMKTDLPEDSRQHGGIQRSPTSCTYDFFVPIKCDTDAGEYMFRITLTDNIGHQAILEHKCTVEPSRFKKQILTLDKEKIKTEATLGLPIAQFESRLESLAEHSPAQKLWRGTFDVPVESQGISTEFGLTRVTQERGKYLHTALDLRAMPRSVIWASNAGKVVLKDRYEHSGNTIVIDHGHGLLSLFFHLDSFADIAVGDTLKKGHPIGTVGKTGYANGYHLHWEMRLHNIPVDPMQWTESAFDA